VAERIQLRRTKGWRKPDGAIVVARPTRWGNPYRPGADHPWYPAGQVLLTREEAVTRYRSDLINRLLAVTVDDARRELAGHDLACWCPLDQPCHADVLLELANPPCRSRSHGADGWHCAVEGPHGEGQHANAAGDVTW